VPCTIFTVKDNNMPLTYEAAIQLILEQVRPLDAEAVPLLEALGRAVAEPVLAPLDLPRFDNSAMDGYALRAADGGPGVALRVTGYLAAGSIERPPVHPGCAVRIMTGAPLPPGADAVVPVEDTDGGENLVTLRGPVPRGIHIRYQGEDLRQGEVAIPVGTVLRPPEISLLASCSRTSVRVVRRPRVAILSTGDELVELGQPLPEGRIVNSNSWSLAASVLELGGVPLQLGIARDTRESLSQKLTAGFAADLLITSAGVSAGDRDLVREALAELGAEEIFWKIEIKPGRPIAFAVKGTVPIFSLPGNPVSTMVTFEEFVRPALLKLMGHRQVLKPLVRATLLEPARKKPGRVQFLRVTVTSTAGGLTVASSGDQHAGILRTSLRANGIAVLPASHGDYAAGEEIEVHLLGRDAEWLTRPEGTDGGKNGTYEREEGS
jgi:molybdopterin molybdotransferase